MPAQEGKNLRTIKIEEITRTIKQMCIEANHSLSPDMQSIFEEATKKEESPLGRQILGQLKENLKIAKEDRRRFFDKGSKSRGKRGIY